MRCHAPSGSAASRADATSTAGPGRGCQPSACDHMRADPSSARLRLLSHNASGPLTGAVRGPVSRTVAAPPKCISRCVAKAGWLWSPDFQPSGRIPRSPDKKKTARSTSAAALLQHRLVLGLDQGSVGGLTDADWRTRVGLITPSAVHVSGSGVVGSWVPACSCSTSRRWSVMATNQLRPAGLIRYSPPCRQDHSSRSTTSGWRRGRMLKSCAVTDAGAEPATLGS